MSDWLDGLHELNRRGEPAVLVTVVETRGSTPREAGAKMAVGRDEIHDTIGGGQLEHAAIESARLLLEAGDDVYTNSLERHELGPALGQCCGGVATLLIEHIPSGAQSWVDALVEARRGRAAAFVATAVGSGDKHVVAGADDPAAGSLPGELGALVKRAAGAGKPVRQRQAGGADWFVDPIPAPDFHIVLFGAGHVGKALAGILGTLPCSLTWVDTRPGQLPDRPAANVRTVRTREPEALVNDCPPGSFYLVMTHSHPLDLAICARILARADFAYCGLIGSQSKRRNFEKRLRLKGITDAALNRLTCPIGARGISGKRPAEIAIAVAAEVLQVRESTPAGSTADVSKTG